MIMSGLNEHNCRGKNHPEPGLNITSLQGSIFRAKFPPSHVNDTLDQVPIHAVRSTTKQYAKHKNKNAWQFFPGRLQIIHFNL